jgi:hypothetical protein
MAIKAVYRYMRLKKEHETYTGLIGQKIPKLQPPKRGQRPSQPVPQGRVNTALSR